MNTFKTMMVAGAVLIFSGVANAQTFGINDTDQIVKVSRGNDLKFARDYKGKTFSGTMIYQSVSKALLGSYYFVTFEEATCRVSDKSVLDAVTDWDKGRKVSVAGKIDTTTMGSLYLENCVFVN